MTVEKSKLKAAFAHDIGCQVDDQLEAAKKKIEQARGGRNALKSATQFVAKLMEHVDKDREEGLLDPTKLDGELAVAALLKRYIQRCAGVVDNLATQGEIQLQQAMGEARGLEQVVQRLKAVHDQEIAKAQAVDEAVKHGTIEVEDGRPAGVDRAVGAHPGNPAADRKGNGASRKNGRKRAADA